jgi:hypothetical protein
MNVVAHLTSIPSVPVDMKRIGSGMIGLKFPLRNVKAAGVIIGIVGGRRSFSTGEATHQ